MTRRESERAERVRAGREAIRADWRRRHPGGHGGLMSAARPGDYL